MADVEWLAEHNVRPWLLAQVDRQDEVGGFARWLVADECEDVGRSSVGIIDLEVHVRRHDDPELLAAFKLAAWEWHRSLPRD